VGDKFGTLITGNMRGDSVLGEPHGLGRAWQSRGSDFIYCRNKNALLGELVYDN